MACVCVGVCVGWVGVSVRGKRERRWREREKRGGGGVEHKV